MTLQVRIEGQLDLNSSAIDSLFVLPFDSVP